MATTKLTLSILLLSLCLSFNASATSRPVDADLTRVLAKDLPDILEKTGVASVSVARIEGGKIIALQASGKASEQRMATVDTRYNVASLTKPISAEVVLRLIAEGVFTLDQSMATAWVDPDIENDPRKAALTPRLALAHRTGFPNWRAPTGLRFERDPGGKAGYSGEGYEYVARFVEHITGLGMDQQAERLLFNPMHMSNTSFTRLSGSLNDMASSRTAAGTWEPPVTRSNASAADDLLTTAHDYATFLISVMHNQALTPALVSERSRIQADTLAETCRGIARSACPDRAGYSLGWELFVFAGQRYYLHTGADDDAFALAYWTPSTASGTVILTNSKQGYLTALPILELIGADPALLKMLRAQAAR